jgi:hypothetical protein
VRFRGGDSLEPGALVEFEINFPGLAQTLTLRGVVVWSSLQASGVTESGVEFRDVKLSEQTMIDRLVEFLRTRV